MQGVNRVETKCQLVSEFQTNLFPQFLLVYGNANEQNENNTCLLWTAGVTRNSANCATEIERLWLVHTCLL